MKARYFLPVLLATVCAAVMAVGNSTVQAAAKAAPAAVDVDPAAEALAQHEGVSLGEATARINRQASQSALADKLAALYPASYAGAYVDQANHGDLVAALLGDEATVKRINFASDGVKLMPSNPAYQPIEVKQEDARIIGKIIGLIRDYEGMAF